MRFSLNALAAFRVEIASDSAHPFHPTGFYKNGIELLIRQSSEAAFSASEVGAICTGVGKVDYFDVKNYIQSLSPKHTHIRLPIILRLTKALNVHTVHTDSYKIRVRLAAVVSRRRSSVQRGRGIKMIIAWNRDSGLVEEPYFDESRSFFLIS